MNKTILLFLSIIWSQVGPNNDLNRVYLDYIPKNISKIHSDLNNINFKEHSTSIKNEEQIVSYLFINSNIKDNYQVKLSSIDFSKDSYIILWDKEHECIYGPYYDNGKNIIYPSIVSGNQILLIYVEPNAHKKNGNFTIESILSLDSYPYKSKDILQNYIRTRERPVLMVTGYWPPTNEMLRHFSQNESLNPNGWQGENWNNLGFDVVSFFPEFNPPDCNNCGQGYGDFEVDYQDTSLDFWNIVEQVEPTGIITFSKGYNNNSWELESNVYNHPSWIADYSAPLYPTPTPPDNTVLPGHNRGSGLPLELLENTLDNSDIDVNCYIDINGDAGQFLSEFMGYHGMWYHQSSLNTDNPCMLGGHIHVGGQLSTRVAKDAAELTIETVINHLNSMIFDIGDINNDSILNIQDLIILIGFILEIEYPDASDFIVSDINEDNILNIQDLILLVNLILE